MSYKVFIPSGAGSPGFGGIAECLRESPGLQLYAGDMNPGAYGKNIADGFVAMPESGNPNYLDAVIKHAKHFKANVILPITTRELYVLSQYREALFKEDLKIAISPYDCLTIANNKAKLYNFVKEHQMPCVPYFVVNNKSELIQKAEELGFPNQKIIIKPAEANGSRGFRIITTISDIKSNYFDTKAGSVNTSMDSLKLELPDLFPFDMLVCEYLPGSEYSVDLLADNGNTLLCLVRLREKTVSGISVKGRFLIEEYIEAYCKKLVKKLSLHGPIGMQFKRNIEGEPQLLEINPRLQGAVSTARFAGINFPLLSVSMAMGEDLNINELSIDYNVSFNRYWKDIKD